MDLSFYIATLRRLADNADKEKEILISRGFCGKPEALIDLSMRIGSLIGEAEAYRNVVTSLGRIGS